MSQAWYQLHIWYQVKTTHGIQGLKSTQQLFPLLVGLWKVVENRLLLHMNIANKNNYVSSHGSVVSSHAGYTIVLASW